MPTISITVSDDVAARYRDALPEDRCKLELLLNLRLQDLVGNPPRSIAAVMDEVGAQVKAAGFTEADLEAILYGE